MIIFRSSTSAGWVASTVSINKPTGLAVGDTMVAVITAADGANAAVNTPSGWTLVINKIDAGTSLSESVFIKTANSSDVSASTFSFTTVSGVALITGSISAIYSSSGTVSASASDGRINEGANSATISISSSMSTTTFSTFCVIGLAGNYLNPPSSTVSSYTINGGANPTWTELSDNYVVSSNVNPISASAYAFINDVRTVTAFGATITNSYQRHAGVIVFFSDTSVTTEAVSNIGLKSAVGNGTIVDDAGAVITERGIVVNTSTNPTVSNMKFSTPGTVGVFSVNLTGLAVNTLYYARAYAVNAAGTVYGNQVTFTTNNITSTELVKDISGVEGATYAVSLNVTGSVGTVTVKLGRSGTSVTFTAGGGVQTMQGVYSGADGIIITRSGTFNGTIDNLLWVRVLGTGTIDWTKATFTTVFPIASEVFFKRIEDQMFNTYRLYRFLDLLFKDYDGYVTVTLKAERNDGVTSHTQTFSVGNTSNPASPFSKKRISFLLKDQAIIIGLSNSSLNETFAIAKFMLSGQKKPRKMFGADKIISIG